jgi:uncharacterized membrane protein
MAGRIVVLDALRALALIGMVVFHVMFDLELFGFIAEGTAASWGWSNFAKLVAGSFICLAGVSLVIAHAEGLRWAAFGRRLAKLVLAALAVSVATYAMMPGQFVYFGILHAIATFSVIGLVFLRLPKWVLAIAIAGVFVAPDLFRSDLFNAPGLWWLGLSTQTAPSMDFEPFFPWFAPFLLGMLVAQWIRARGGFERVKRYKPGESGTFARALLWAGRNTLVLYLVHQPILFALFWAATLVI